MSDTDEALVGALFHEHPKSSPAIAALVLYLVIGFAILAVTIRTRAWFMLTISITAFLEFAGYVARVLVLHKPSIGLFAMMQALLIISPVLLSL